MQTSRYKLICFSQFPPSSSLLTPLHALSCMPRANIIFMYVCPQIWKQQLRLKKIVKIFQLSATAAAAAALFLRTRVMHWAMHAQQVQSLLCLSIAGMSSWQFRPDVPSVIFKATSMTRGANITLVRIISITNTLLHNSFFVFINDRVNVYQCFINWDVLNIL